ncbi:MAG: FAD-dependent monooxygenase [Actinobacteria bacterium]|nr:FAD-dependent monooxygenase [Actinomycetota bacterium]
MDHVDVAVVGAGPAGCAAAIALARAGARVAVLHRPIAPATRGESLPPEIRVPLGHLGLWDPFTADGHVGSPGMIVVWGSATPHANDFAFSPYGSGWHVDRDRFDRFLQTAATRAGAVIHTGVRLNARHRRAGGWRFARDGEPWCLQADFALDATGRSAWLARALGLRRTMEDRLVGIVATGRPVTSDRRALIESCPDGWWYSARIDGDRHTAAFLTDAAHVARSGLPPQDLWRARLPSAPVTHTRIAELTAVGSTTRVASASTSRLPKVCGIDWAAIGDAAATIDPLAGRGVERALSNGIAIARALGSAHRRSALHGYAAAASAQFADDQRQRRIHYRQESRWPDAPFWARRHDAGHQTSTSTSRKEDR